MSTLLLQSRPEVRAAAIQPRPSYPHHSDEFESENDGRHTKWSRTELEA